MCDFSIRIVSSIGILVDVEIFPPHLELSNAIKNTVNSLQWTLET